MNEERPIARRGGPWWGRFSVEEEEAAHFGLGPLRLWVERRPSEWRISCRSEPDHRTDDILVEVPAAAPAPESGVHVHRFVTPERGGSIHIRPRPADRPVVSRPDPPVVVSAGARAVLYLSTPVWVELRAGDPPFELVDLPTFRPSDTWFGASTLEGALCYASHTSARMSLESLNPHRTRAFTKVVLHNSTSEQILLERLSLPARDLSMFADSDGFLWTETVTVEPSDERQLARVRFSAAPPDEAPGAERVCGPRDEHKGNVLMRALEALVR